MGVAFLVGVMGAEGCKHRLSFDAKSSEIRDVTKRRECEVHSMNAILVKHWLVIWAIDGIRSVKTVSTVLVFDDCERAIRGHSEGQASLGVAKSGFGDAPTIVEFILFNGVAEFPRDERALCVAELPASAMAGIVVSHDLFVVTVAGCRLVVHTKIAAVKRVSRGIVDGFD